MKSFIETHIGLMLIGAAVLGFFIPAAGAVPSQTVVILLAVVIFLACLRIQMTDFKGLSWGNITLFWFGRFVVLPIILYGISVALIPAYASALLLLALLPAGASSPAFTGLFGGNVPAALFLTLLSSATSVIVIPLVFASIGQREVAPPAAMLFITLLECVLIPAIAAWPLRRVTAVKQVAADYGKVLTVMLLAVIVLIIIAQQREVILSNPADLLMPLIITVASYALFIAVGAIVFRSSPATRITSITCSAYYNSALGITLAALAFSHEVVLTIIVAEICWTFLPLATQWLTERVRLQIVSKRP